MSAQLYSIDETEDEFGVPRFFVADENGDWISEPLDTREQARSELAFLLNQRDRRAPQKEER